MNKIVQEVTEKIITRSQTTRAAYLQLYAPVAGQ